MSSGCGAGGLPVVRLGGLPRPGLVSTARDPPSPCFCPLQAGDALGGSVLDFMPMKPYSDVSLDISMLGSLGRWWGLPYGDLVRWRAMRGPGWDHHQGAGRLPGLSPTLFLEPPRSRAATWPRLLPAADLSPASCPVPVLVPVAAPPCGPAIPAAPGQGGLCWAWSGSRLLWACSRGGPLGPDDGGMRPYVHPQGG